jgi:excisionase family DNA binding protein
MVDPATMNFSETSSALLTVGEASELLHVHANTLRRWNDAGLLASYRIGSRGDRRFWRDDVIRFLTRVETGEKMVYDHTHRDVG